MTDRDLERRFDSLAVQLHDWTDSAVALDEGHFPSELLSDLEDVVEEFKAFLEDAEGAYKRTDVTELFISPEMAEVIERFSKVRRYLERAWGSQLTEQIEEEGVGFTPLEEEDED